MVYDQLAGHLLVMVGMTILLTLIYADGFAEIEDFSEDFQGATEGEPGVELEK